MENTRQAAGQAAGQRPPRRIGSCTLGVTLILCGICFLLYYFVPGFNFVLVAKLSPLVVIALGAEILYFCARPERGKYDMLSILACLFIMLCCFGLTLVPTLWQYAGPARGQQEQVIDHELESKLYDRLKDSNVYSLSVSVSLNEAGSVLPQSAAELDGTENVQVYVYLAGDYSGYSDKDAFARDSRRVLEALEALGVEVDAVDISTRGEYTETGLSLYIRSPYAMAYSAEALAAEVEQWGGAE